VWLARGKGIASTSMRYDKRNSKVRWFKVRLSKLTGSTFRKVAIGSATVLLFFPCIKRGTPMGKNHWHQGDLNRRSGADRVVMNLDF